MKKNILVSVVVVSYNAEKTIIETLDSIKKTNEGIQVNIMKEFGFKETVKTEADYGSNIVVF